VLEGAGQAQRCPRRRLEAADVLATKENAALLRPIETRNTVEKRGLAGAIWTDHRRNGVLRYRKTDVPQGSNSTERQVNVDGFKNFHATPNVPGLEFPFFRRIQQPMSCLQLRRILLLHARADFLRRATRQESCFINC